MLDTVLVPTGTPATDADFHPLDDSGSGQFEIAYVQSEVSMNAHVRCCYANARSELGPMSDAAVEIITD